MRVLIDIGHPAHVHYFRNLAKKITDEGGSVLFTLREKEMALSLIQAYGFDYVSFGKPERKIWRKALAQFTITVKLFFTAKKFRPDVIVNSTHYSAFVAWLTGKPHISIEDTFNMEQVRLYQPFTSVILTGNYPHPGLKKQILVDAFQESLYLRSGYFTPDPGVLDNLGLKQGETFTVVRFVSWTASHDIGQTGLTPENKVKAVQSFLRYGKVFITSEVDLPSEIEQYRVRVAFENIHHLLYYASLIFSESATMISEAALLGTPGIYLDDNGRYYTRHLSEKYGIVSNYTGALTDQQKAIEEGCTILSDRRKILLKNVRQAIENHTIDFTCFLYEVVNTAHSLGRRKTTPGRLLKEISPGIRSHF